MKSFLGDSKWIVYAALNVLFCGVLLFGAAAGGGSLAKLPYLVLLFALCSSPIPFIDKPNGAFAMLGVAMAIYFVTLGLLDALSMFSPPANFVESGDMLSPGELVILVGLSMFILGFHLAVGMVQPKSQGGSWKDWPLTMLLSAGLVLWLAGGAAEVYRSLVVVADNSNAAANAGFSHLGIWWASGLILVQVYAGPLGIIILAYWWTVTGRRAGDALMILVVVCEFAVGWVVDTKSIAVGAAFIILLTRFFVLGKVPLRLLAVSVIGAALVFPVLTAKRQIMGEQHLTRAQALPHTGEILWRAIEHRDTYSWSKYGDPTPTFLERVTVKASIEKFAQNVGETAHPYRMGSTLEPLLYTFVPRALWTDKPSVNSSQTFNREFHISADPDTHISPTHLGELYWNFGFGGVIIGMTLIGALLGYVNVRFDPSVQTSLTRTLVVMVTMYELLAHLEGSIGNEYVVWIRTMVLIGILHFIFARRRVAQPVGAATWSNAATNGPASRQPDLFPNLLR